MLLDIYLGLHSANEGEPVGPGFVLYNFPDQESLELHVIGPCGECKWWAGKFVLPPGLPPEAVKDLEGTHRQCEQEECPVMLAPIGFGCIYFKEKEKNERSNVYR